MEIENVSLTSVHYIYTPFVECTCIYLVSLIFDIIVIAMAIIVAIALVAHPHARMSNKRYSHVV